MMPQATVNEKAFVKILNEDDVNFTDIDGFYNFEVQVNGEVIAELSHDAFNYSNPWYVSVSGVEVYRSALYYEATDWVKLQYVAGTLALHQPTETTVLLDIPFDELSSEEWERVKNYPAVTESVELVAA
ncbi:hypothetical protein [Nostoc sp.]|uniref:hypothetical protein n=1 Tax=Nostoc sp. TaxID=1180 RepID=UPI002FF3EF40